MNSEILLYQTEDGSTKIEVALENETVWLTGRQMAELFQKDSDTIGLHIRNIYKEGELTESTTTEKNSVVHQEGGRLVTREINFYNLDVIISVGYRVKSTGETPDFGTPLLWFVRCVSRIMRPDAFSSACRRSTSAANVPPDSASNCSRVWRIPSSIGFFIIITSKKFCRRTNEQLTIALVMRKHMSAGGRCRLFSRLSLFVQGSNDKSDFRII